MSWRIITTLDNQFTSLLVILFGSRMKSMSPDGSLAVNWCQRRVVCAYVRSPLYQFLLEVEEGVAPPGILLPQLKGLYRLQKVQLLAWSWGFP